MTADLQNCYYGDVEKKEDAWIDIHGPIMVCVEYEVIGVGGAIKRVNDILKTKKSGKKEKLQVRTMPLCVCVRARTFCQSYLTLCLTSIITCTTVQSSEDICRP